MPEPLELIRKALRLSHLIRMQWETEHQYIIEGLTPNARRATKYLRMREYISMGCRRAVKDLDVPYKRSIAYSILMRACINIFHYGMSDDLLAIYNQELDEMIGIH